MMTLTPEQQEIADAAALAIATLPLEQRPDLLIKIGCAYEDAIERQWPELTREQVIEHSRNYTIAILSRVREIDLSTGGAPIGRA